jgi:2-aminoethylphosphonate-pyruvate transaminase
MTSYLLTPGPLTTSDATRRAMNRDWGSRDKDFIGLTRRLRERLCRIAEAGPAYTCVPLQGSGTFIIEAALQTLVPADGKLLVLINGAYGRRMVEIMRRAGREVDAIEVGEDETIPAARVAERLAADPAVTDVALVHCETTAGILNPLESVAEAVRRAGRRLLVDAMSSFGALPIATEALGLAAIVASSNKCLEGVPGIGFAVVDTSLLAARKGNAASLTLDLHAQWRGFEENGQWRFTPPTQVLAALGAALDQHEAEGGVAARAARYAANCRALVDGMRRLGFRTLLSDAVQAPIIVTFLVPPHPAFRFAEFYDRLHARGFVIYPGKLTKVDSFRIGCIGAIDDAVITRALDAVETVMREMGMTPGGLYNA